jgi:hypothetical protein
MVTMSMAKIFRSTFPHFDDNVVIKIWSILWKKKKEIAKEKKMEKIQTNKK